MVATSICVYWSSLHVSSV
jgi:pentatricopeptide repeat protein